MNAGTKRGAPLAVALGLLVVATAGLTAVTAPAAHAVPVDTSQTGTINIYKYQTPATNTSGDGTQQTPTTVPIPGVTYRITPVTVAGGLTVADNAWWTTAEGIADSTDTTSGTKGISLAPVVTDSAGLAAFTNLPLGLYYVEETAVPTGVGLSEPFYVTVPLTDPTNLDAWLYTVYAYPKDSVTTVAKTVTDATATKAGDVVTFTVTASVPKEAALTKYALTDTLDPRLSLVDAAVSLDGTALTASVDYALSGTSTITADFTKVGMAKLTALSSGIADDTVTLTVHAKVLAAGPFGAIPNAAVLDWDNGSGAVSVPSNTVTTDWGTVVLTKTSSTTGDPLPGAVFVLYATQADASANANPIMTAVDGGDGTYTFAGVRANDWQDGATLAPPSSYWVAETKSPAGYQLIPQPFPVQLLGVTDAAYTATAAISEPPSDPFRLAATGGYGRTATYAMYGGAAVLLLGVAGAVFFRRRVEAREAVV